MLGDKERAERAFAAAVSALDPVDAGVPNPSRSDYGTGLRDAAAVLALMGETGVGTASLTRAANVVTARRSRQSDTTTQESLWLLLAARTLDAQNKDVALDVNGSAVRGAFQAVLSGGDIAKGSVRILNVGQAQPAGASQLDSVISSEDFSKDGLKIRNTGADAVQASVS